MAMIRIKSILGNSRLFGQKRIQTTGAMARRRSRRLFGVMELEDRVVPTSTASVQVNYPLLMSFGSPVSSSPYGGVVPDAQDDLFGATYQGGANDLGAVYELVKGTGGVYTYLPLFSFGSNVSSTPLSYGQEPTTGLAIDSQGDIFGTSSGGINGALFGNAYELVKGTNGSYTYVNLLTFNSNYGYLPNGGVILDSQGDLFGTTDYSDTGEGTVYELKKGEGGSYTYINLLTFNGSDGANPFAGLTFDSQGDLFGTTFNGGANNLGTVFELVNGSNGSYTYTNLFSFSNSTGTNPYSGVTLDAQGDLFGTTELGGSDNEGTIYELVKGTDGSYTYVNLISSGGTFATPYSGVTLDSQGDLFGTLTANGGETVYELVKGSSGGYTYNKTNLVTESFPSGFSAAGVVFDAQGNLFGITAGGGANNQGSAFELTKGTGGSYAYTNLFSFGNSDPDYSITGVKQDAQGNLYGASTLGGADGFGTVFELVKGPSGAYTYTTLLSFNGINGMNPNAGVTLDAQGDLFGTTTFGGNHYDGEVYELVYGSGGTYTYSNLFSFNGTNGKNPRSGVILDAKGDLFGTTSNGGAYGNGTVFELAKEASGTYSYTDLFSFDGSDGSEPAAEVTLDSQGDLFGTTYEGGEYGDGTLFELAKETNGVYSYVNLLSFNGANGAQPEATVTLDAQGDLFGTTYKGGATNDGTVFELVNGTGGSYSLVNLISFTSNQSSPVSGVTFNAQGDLFGSTLSNAYEIVKGLGGSYTITNFFSPNESYEVFATAGLTSENRDDLYGTTAYGGEYNVGTVWQAAGTAYGQTVTLSAAVSATFGFGTPTGSVTFYDGSELLGTAELSNGVATLATAALAVGNNTISVSYSGDSSYAAGSAQGGVVDVSSAATTSTLTSSSLPSVVGQTVTLTASIGNAYDPTGTVTFYDAGTALGTATVSNDIATLATSFLSASTHSLTSSYSGDSNNLPSSGTLSQVVNQDTTTVTLSTSLNPSLYGQAVTFTASVTAEGLGAGTPTGIVTFYDSNDSPLDSVELAAGTATFTTSSLAVGTHTISATYSGDSNFLASNTAAPISQIVNPSGLIKVAGVVVNDSQVQQSRVTSITVIFSTIVDANALDQAFSLTRVGLPNGAVGDNVMIGVISVSTSVVDGETVATLGFSGANTEGGSLADGIWTLTINHTDVVNNGNMMAADYQQTNIKRLYGDFTGNGYVDSTDLGYLGATFGLMSNEPGFLAMCDNDGNGVIDSTDLDRFGGNYGLSI